MKRWGIFILGLALLGLRPPAVSAQTSSFNEYWQFIIDLQELIVSLENEPVTVQQTQLTATASQLVPITAVSLPDGRQLPISHNFLLNELGREPPDLARLKQLLAAWQTARVTWPEVQFDDLDEATLQAILSQPEFQYKTAEPSRWQRWLENIRLDFLRWLLSLLPENVPNGVGYIVNRVLTFLGVIALIVVLFYALRNLFWDFTAEAALSLDDHLGDEQLTADAALQQAQQFSASGDYRTAVRYLYLSALLLLEERGLLRYNRSLTNREYLRSLAHQPELAAILRDVIEVFDRVWYGFHTLEQPEYEWYVQRVEVLKRQRKERHE